MLSGRESKEFDQFKSLEEFKEFLFKHHNVYVTNHGKLYGIGQGESWFTRSYIPKFLMYLHGEHPYDLMCVSPGYVSPEMIYEIIKEESYRNRYCCVG